MSTTPYDWLVGHAERNSTGAAVLTWRGGEVTERLDWGSLRTAVDRSCAGLVSRCGLGRGDRVMLSLPNDSSFVVTLLAVMGAGAIPVPTAVPTVQRAAAFRERLLAMLRACEPTVLVTTDRWAPLIRDLIGAEAGCRVVSATEIMTAGTVPFPRPVPGPGDGTALLQFSSGSTGVPKGIVVTQKMLQASCGQAAATYEEGAEDTAVTWVPLYHDMGLVTAVLRPLHSGYPTVLLTPEEFVRSPVSWLKAIDSCGGTLASAPNFAYDLCVRKTPLAEARQLDLSRWRVARNAGEVVRARTVDRFAAHFADAGFRSAAMCPSYGLAEATLTVTTCRPDTPPLRLTARRDALEAGHLVVDASADGHPLISSGPPVVDTEIRIRDVDEDGQVGEVMIKGPQVFRGHWQAPSTGRRAAQPESLWYPTGDLGFLRQGHLFVLGRADDTLVVNGRNHFAPDIAAACAAVSGIRPGRVAAFLIDDPAADVTRVRLVAELTRTTGTSPAELDRLAKAVQRELATAMGLFVDGVDFVGAGELPVTTSGKVRSSETRRRWAAGTVALSGQV